eukprot:TRINITY_DN1782_c0_g1_i1.p1 TRINITY_DN1782_c0_g1~~TRINITY_DN1782_c0_g1_i1.p1  ORF type:complete len:536 (+),score=124.28 TRINITY_DN1782_c0_g1_i1:112-1719(+)
MLQTLAPMVWSPQPEMNPKRMRLQSQNDPMNYDLQFCELPEEIVFLIIDWMLPQDRRKARQVNKWMKSLVDSVALSITAESDAMVNIQRIDQVQYITIVERVFQPQDDVEINFATQFPNLREFTLRNYDLNNCTDAGVRRLATTCSQLRALRLGISATFVRNDALVALSQHCKNLQTLQVRAAGITDTALISLAQNCRQLTELDIGDCYRITDEAMPALAYTCTRLRIVDLSFTSITDCGLYAFAACRELISLNALECNIRDRGAVTVHLAAHCKHLQVLGLSTPFVDMELLARNAKELQSLYIFNAMELHELDLDVLLTSYPTLRVLDMSGSPYSISLLVKQLVKRQVYLREVAFARCSSMNDEALVRLSAVSQCLVRVNLSGTMVTSEALSILLNNCDMLESLSVAQCRSLTNDFCAHLPASLTYLSVSDLFQITDLAFGWMARRCPMLKVLVADRMGPFVTDAALQYLGEGCHNLREVHLQDCRITDAGLQFLAQSCPNLWLVDIFWSQFITATGLRLFGPRCHIRHNTVRA